MASQQYPSQGSYPPPGAMPPPYIESEPHAQPQPQPPPPAQQPPPQPAKGAPAAKPAQPEKKGFFSNFMKEAEKVGKQITVGIDKAGEKINETVDKNYSSALLDLFKTGNVVQLISRVTGRTVQIVISPTGQMVLDANGPLDPSAFNTLWTVTNEGSNQIRLHNYNNYICILDGLTALKPYVNPADLTHGLETKFQLSQIHQQFVMLESLKEKARHIGFIPTGELKPALASGKEPNSQFGVKLVDLFKTGNVVQLISRVTGRTVQIVISPTGQMVLDANGPLDPSAFNTLWTVTNEGSNQIRLHNYNNYICILDGLTALKPYVNPADLTHGLETKFQLSQIHQQFVMLESLKEKARHIGFIPTGELKPALASGKEPNSQFGVKLVSTAYPIITPVATVPPK